MALTVIERARRYLAKCSPAVILVEAYDLFKAIYQERGYRSKDIPRLILEKNLFGLEIDDRAAQLAAFALLMKARADDRRIFADHVQPNVIAIQESKGLENLLRPDPAAAKGVGELPFADSDLFPQTDKQLTLTKPNQESPLAAVEPCLRELINLFEHGKNFGSLIRVPPELAAQLSAARQSIEAMAGKGKLWEYRAATLLLPLIKQAELLAKTYDAVVTNPPYMGSKFYNPLLKDFVAQNYNEGKSDLYGCFIQRAIFSTKAHGFMGMITIPNWMFLSGFERLRQVLLEHSTIDSFLHNGRGVWGSDFGSCSFTIRNHPIQDFRATYRRLFDKQGSVANVEELRNRFFTSKGFQLVQAEIHKIPGSPIAYWVSDRVRSIFAVGRLLEHVAKPKQGMTTSDNNRFLRYWFEVNISKIAFGMASLQEASGSGGKWFPYNKGGGFRKWFGNAEYVVNYGNDGSELKAFHEVLNRTNPGGRLKNQVHYFQAAVSWSKITIGDFSTRYFPAGFIFDVAGSSVFFKDEAESFFFCGLLNSKVAKAFLAAVSPTLNYEAEHICVIPIMKEWHNDAQDMTHSIVSNSRSLFDKAKVDWNSFETAWEFSQMPLLCEQIREPAVEDSYNKWKSQCELSVAKTKTLEEQNNRLFIAAYGLKEELIPEVRDDEIPLARADRERDMQRLLSYSIGCMMGRYSLDKPGLVYVDSRKLPVQVS